jgi:hypothetical protein
MDFGNLWHMCIFICDFLHIVRPLINLMKKDVPFIFGTEQCEAMQILKDSVLSSPTLKHLDYASEHKVILVVDTLNIAIRYSLLQVGEDQSIIMESATRANLDLLHLLK